MAETATKKKARGRPKGSKNKPKAPAAKKKTAVTGRKKKAKQKYIPGTEPPSIPVIDKTVESYVDIRDRRMDLTEEEVELKRSLREQMKAAKLQTYDCNGYKVVVEPGEETVKVKKAAKKKEDLDV